MDITLARIKRAFERTEILDGDDVAPYFEAAIQNLEAARDALETVSVKGRVNIDKLLGCMMGIDMIIGEVNDDG
ncbi:MAG: hypothetical protein J6S14_02025 [Clostridia bacterium]|nr:hypothetical protein [Clostridia bacterium]